MIQNNSRAQVSAKTLHPAWVLLLIAVAVVVAVAWSWPKRWQPDPVRQAELARVGQLFADGRIEQALAQLETAPLLGSAEAAFARAAILSYTPFVDFNRPDVTPLLLTAAEQGLPAAQILLGWALQLDPACSDCSKEARQWFERALWQKEDRDARLGLALSWSSQGIFHPMNRHLEVLLADPAADDVRALALAFRTPDIDPREKGDLFRESAEQGWAEAQLQYATRYLETGAKEARLWIAMAAAQGHARAIETADRLGIPEDLRSEAERRLLNMASNPTVAIGKAADWCARLSSVSQMKRCRLRALENHLSCRVPRSTTDVLGIQQFEKTKIYADCRLRQLSAE
jgi:TPR repeat protein